MATTSGGRVTGGTVTMRGFGELESAIMQTLWDSGHPATVREVLERLREQRVIAYTTVMTVMDTLHRKKWLTRVRDGRAYRYHPVSTRTGYVAELMRDVLTCSTDHTATLVQFTEQLSEQQSIALRTALRRNARKRRT